MKARIQIILAGFFLMLAIAPASVQAQNWSSDPVHSTVMYTIRHGLTPMVGMFKKFNINMTLDPENATEAKIDGTLDVSSVMMGMDKLEGHLKSPDFFDAEKYPEWSFVSTGVKAVKKSDSKFVATGDLTVRGVTKTIEVPFELLGVNDTERGKKAGISAEFTIDRNDYGVGQGHFADTKGLGGDVKVTIYLEMNAKK